MNKSASYLLLPNAYCTIYPAITRNSIAGIFLAKLIADVDRGFNNGTVSYYQRTIGFNQSEQQAAKDCLVALGFITILSDDHIMLNQQTIEAAMQAELNRE